MKTIPLSPEVATQELLRRYVRSRNRRLELERAQNETAARIFEILDAGGTVETGTHHARLRTKCSAGRLARYLVVDGTVVD